MKKFNRPEGMNRLAEFIRAEMQRQNLSYNDVANRGGNKITHGTIWNIVNGNVKQLRPESIDAIARGLQLAPEKLWTIALSSPRAKSEHAYSTRAVSLPQGLWDRLEQAAQQGFRTPDQQLAAILASTFEQQSSSMPLFPEVKQITQPVPLKKKLQPARKKA